MKTIKLVQPSSKKLRLIQHLIKNGIRVFRRAALEAKLTNELDLSYQAFGVMLHNLCQEGWVTQIRRGIYIVANTATPIYEQEIAMALVSPAMVSHASAFHHHGLTDQVLGSLQVTTTNTNFIRPQEQVGKKSVIKLNGVTYEFIRINPEKFFGEEVAWIGDGKFQVTDLERTLLDGLGHPQYCGGLQEVMHAYQEYFEKVNLEKIINYALRLDVAISRRLGWVLNNLLDVGIEQINCLTQKDRVGYRLLDPSRADLGPYDPVWRVRLNHHAEVVKLGEDNAGIT